MGIYFFRQFVLQFQMYKALLSSTQTLEPQRKWASLPKKGNGHLGMDYLSDVNLFKDNPCTDMELERKQYLSEVKEISLNSGGRRRFLTEPSAIMENVYVGSTSHAESKAILKKLGITHVLNCAGYAVLRGQTEQRYLEDFQMDGYEELPTEAGTTYDMTHHFCLAHLFIEHAQARGKILIFSPEVDRSACIAISFMMKRGMPLLKAVTHVQNSCRCGMTNEGFMLQLVQYAQDHDTLSKERSYKLETHSICRSSVRSRGRYAHILAMP